MLSTCPTCLDQVNHPDHLFEVECKCGSKFNPFMSTDMSPEEPTGEPSRMNENQDASPLTDANVGGEFKESSAVFAELIEFGEGLSAVGMAVEKSGTRADSGGAPTPVETKAAPPARAAASAAVPMDGDCLMSAGDSLQGYAVEAYLPPLSVACDLDLSGADPLKPAFDLLWSHAKEAGANGVLALKWSLTPDATKVILSGTPVLCARTQ